MSAGPSNVYDGHYSDADYYFINETAINASGTRPVHGLEMSLSKTTGGSALMFDGSVRNLGSQVFNGFVLVFIVENDLVDPDYPTITWNSVFRDYGLNKTLNLAGLSVATFSGTWAIPSTVNVSNVEVMAAAYDSDSRDPTYGWPYTVQSVCTVCGSARDIGYVARRFMCTLADPLWDPVVDVNSDGKIDMKDIGMAAKRFWES